MKKFARTAALALAVAAMLTAAGKPAHNSGTTGAGDAPSGLNSRDFKKYWQVESESPDWKVTFRGDTAEITAPAGLTLWRREKMKGDVTVEYDACVVTEHPDDRLSDLNCFWMATDPTAKDVFANASKRKGVFLNCYGLRLYYLGYGGNHNTTTRFRRYDGDTRGITDAAFRPKVLREYTDSAHLLRPGKWYHVKITRSGRRTEYFIDGERLVDFRDADPLTEGWFGFRSTLSRTRITNFRYTSSDPEASPVPLHWIGDTPERESAVTFGVPFNPGELLSADGAEVRNGAGAAVPTDRWPLARWQDGSVKWLAVAGIFPPSDSLRVVKTAPGKKKSKLPADAQSLRVDESAEGITVNTGAVTAYIPRRGDAVIDSLLLSDGTRIAGKGILKASTQSSPDIAGGPLTAYVGEVDAAEVERAGDSRAVVKLTGRHKGTDGREWLPFTVRLYFYTNSPEIKMIHTFVYDGDQNKDFIRSLGVSFDVPMREEVYNRHVAFSTAGGGVWSEPVQPIVGRRVLRLPEGYPLEGEGSLQERQMRGERIPSPDAFDDKNRSYLEQWATWDGFRLSQPGYDGYTVRKRAKESSPWIGTHGGAAAGGYVFAGDVSGGLGLYMKDFRESCPSSLEVSGATAQTATLTAWLWSPESEPMDLRHYDDRAHGLEASYEDVQEGMSTPYGIARTSELTLLPSAGYRGKALFASDAEALAAEARLLPVPEYLHSREAFGIWSLPDRSTPARAEVEDKLDTYIDFYANAIEQNRWYGFWNYGDVMHAYDPVRHQWRYDVGGYAWDNTELASPMWLWYSFLRSGDQRIWKMAEAMTRHNGEVDVYHTGPNAGLGSRHNVSHWGCGAKEGRISQAAWNRFYHYLTADERCADLMHEVTDADTLLYTLDPMRLAEPRSMYPCTAPARLRIGPDWLSYAANWMTEWERTGNTSYRDKIITGMKSIVALPSGLLTGPLALGYDPATGVITTECDSTLRTTNHLMTIMGGFEIMNEMMRMVDVPGWKDAWLEHAALYKKVTRNKFRLSRLQGYAAWQLRDADMARDTWHDLLTMLESVKAPRTVRRTLLPPEVPAPQDELLPVSTNDAALWSLDAIFLQEVLPPDAY